MTYEQAVYFILMILEGYTDEYDSFLESELKEEPWQTMYLMNDFYSDALGGMFAMDDYNDKFNEFINHGISFNLYQEAIDKHKKESFFHN